MANEFLDSRDLEKELEELLEKRDDEDQDDLTEEEQEELKELEELKEECEGYGWEYGINFIADWYFHDYARELAEDCYELDPKNPLSNHIDWNSWADAVEMDYTEVEFRGTTYQYREA